MDSKPPNRNLGMLLVVAGVAVLAGAIVLFSLDADPAWLFGDPALSAILGLGAVGLLYLGWKQMRSKPAEE
jgi:hypothetical protein